MNQQSENTRLKISSILEQIGMTDEELYQLLYGKKQQVEIEIALPQLMDEEIWLETEHSEEELVHMAQQIAVLEQLVNTPPEGAALATLETILEGELLPDEVRGFLLKKRLANWRQGLGQFLAFLAFSKLQQLAISLAALTAPHLIGQFDKTKNRPHDRQLLAEFILKQVEQPLPPIIAILAESGAMLSQTGALEYTQPLTAALLQQSPEKIAQLLNIMEAEPLPESPAELSKPSNTQERSEKTAALLNKLIMLDRVENLIANQQALQQPPVEISQQQNQNDQQQPRRSNRRRAALRDVLEKEKAAALLRAETEAQTTPKTEEKTHTQRLTNTRPQNTIVRNNSPTKPTATKKPTNNPPKELQGLFEGIALDALKGITASNVDPEQLGKTRSSLPKDHSIKPITPPER